MNEAATQAPDFGAVTQVQQQMWANGDFSVVAKIVQGVAEDVAEAADIYPTDRVLDVACGSGNATLAAARLTWDGVVGLDYVPALLERGRERAAAERLDAKFVEGDAQDLPFEDASFDRVLSVFGVMFAPDQEKSAAELLRVTKPGGKIALACWTPDGYIGQVFGTVAKHLPPPPGIKPPSRWGTDDGVRELLGSGASDIQTEKRICRQRFVSAEQQTEFMTTFFGPSKTAMERLDEEAGAALTRDQEELAERFNVADGEGLIIDAEYLLTVATKG